MSEEWGTYKPAASDANPPAPHRAPFPWQHLAFAVGYALIAWFVFWLLVALGVLHFVTVAVTAKRNDELISICRAVMEYLRELLAYITLTREEKPFPFGPFPTN